MPYDMNMPKAFKARLYFQAMASMSRAVQRKELSFVRNAAKSTLTGLVAQLVQRACDALKTFSLLRSLWVLIQPYLFNATVLNFQVTAQ